MIGAYGIPDPPPLVPGFSEGGVELRLRPLSTDKSGVSAFGYLIVIKYNAELSPQYPSSRDG